jgi:hypothetical protein
MSNHGVLNQDVRLGRANDDSHRRDGIHQVRFMTKNTIILLEMPFFCKRFFSLVLDCSLIYYIH